MKIDVQAARNAVDEHSGDQTHRCRLARTLMEAAWSDGGTNWRAYYQEAEKVLESILADDPRNEIALVNLGAALSDQGSRRRAMEYYGRAKALGWVDGNLQYNIAVVLANNCDDAAVRYFENANVQPDHPDTIRAYFDPQAH